MADLNNLLQDIDDPDDSNVFADENDEIVSYKEDTNIEQEDGFLRNDSNGIEDEYEEEEGENDALQSQQQENDEEQNDKLVDGEEEDLEYTQLKRLWITEMSCPELFPFDPETFDMHKNLLQGQEELIAELSNAASSSHLSTDATGQPVSVRNKKKSKEADPNLTSLAASIYRMEADRVRFLLADLARFRLTKIESHPLYMRNMRDRMSENEVKYLISYGELLEKHLRRTVLNHMPRDSLKKLDEPEMIDSPDLDEYVFCKIMENVVIGDETSGINEEDDENFDGMDGPQEYAAGSSLIARYDLVKDLVLEGKIELLL